MLSDLLEFLLYLSLSLVVQRHHLILQGLQRKSYLLLQYSNLLHPLIHIVHQEHSLFELISRGFILFHLVKHFYINFTVHYRIEILCVEILGE